MRIPGLLPVVVLLTSVGCSGSPSRARVTDSSVGSDTRYAAVEPFDRFAAPDSTVELWTRVIGPSLISIAPGDVTTVYWRDVDGSGVQTFVAAMLNKAGTCVLTVVARVPRTDLASIQDPSTAHCAVIPKSRPSQASGSSTDGSVGMVVTVWNEIADQGAQSVLNTLLRADWSELRSAATGSQSAP